MKPIHWSSRWTVALTASLVVIIAGVVTVVVTTSPRGRSSAKTAPSPSTSSSPDILAPLACALISRGLWCVGDGGGNGAPPTNFWSGDGRGWSEMKNGPNYAHDSEAYVDDLACASTKQCMAVGDDECNVRCSVSESPLAVEWSGSSWNESSPELRTGEGSGAFTSVACPQVHLCFAVGWTIHGALTERWSGGGWTVQPNPLASAGAGGGAGGGDELLSVSCPTADFCVAVGSFLFRPIAADDRLTDSRITGLQAGVTTASSVTAIETWNGSRWSAAIVQVPRVTPMAEGLAEVACPTASMCAAVGPRPDGAGAVLVQWNGRAWRAGGWPLTETPATIPSFSCTDGWCMALYRPSTMPPGATSSAVVDVDVWTGGRWAVAKGVRVATDFSTSHAYATRYPPPPDEVACSSDRACVASIYMAADSGPCAPSQTWYSYWNGVAWRTSDVQRYMYPADCR